MKTSGILSVRQTLWTLHPNCPVTGRPIDTARPWSVFRGFDAVAPDVEAGVSAELAELCQTLNDAGPVTEGDAHYGLADTRTVGHPDRMANRMCTTTERDLGTIVIADQSAIAPALGLGMGYTPQRVSVGAVERHAPRALADLVNRLRGTPTQAERAEADRQAEADAAERERQAELRRQRAAKAHQQAIRDRAVAALAALSTRPTDASAIDAGSEALDAVLAVINGK